MVYRVPYKYIKDESFDPIYKTYNHRFFLGPKVIPTLFIIGGLAIFSSQVVLPFVYIKKDESNARTVKESVLGAATGFGDFSFSELAGFGPAKDLPVSAAEPEDQNVPEFFYITIKKLGIENALVETNAASLKPDTALGHYPNSALPGNAGNMFIFGHSVLPIFYNPKDYKRIFSTLDALTTGDEVVVTYNNREFIYLIEGKEVLKPINVDPLAEYKPRYLNESTITLMTCYPAGSKALRLLVRGVLSSR